MGWTVKKGPYVVRLTQGLISLWATMNRLPHDRGLQDARVAWLDGIIANDEFRSPEWASCEVKDTGLTYRVNGKHTGFCLSKLVEGNLPKVDVIVTEFSCQTMQEAAKLYSTFDPSQSSKRAVDIYRIYGQNTPLLEEVSGKTLHIAAVGMGYALWEGESHRRTNDLKGQLIVANPQFVLWLESLLSSREGSSNGHIRRMPCIAAMFKTWQSHALDATKFWMEVRDETNPDHENPSRVLAKRLTMVCLKVSAYKSKKNVMHDHEMYVKCIHAWNAWKKGMKTSLRYFENTGTPEIV